MVVLFVIEKDMVLFFDFEKIYVDLVLCVSGLFGVQDFELIVVGYFFDFGEMCFKCGFIRQMVIGYYLELICWCQYMCGSCNEGVVQIRIGGVFCVKWWIYDYCVYLCLRFLCGSIGLMEGCVWICDICFGIVEGCVISFD